MNQGDVDAGLVENSAQITAACPIGAVEAEADKTVELVRGSYLTVGKSRSVKPCAEKTKK